MPGSERLQDFFLPLVTGALLALPVYFFHGDEQTATEAAAVLRAQPEASCSPFAETFAGMRAEADRIAEMAAFLAPTSEERPDAGAAAQGWLEISAAARALDAWVAKAQRSSVGLTLGETAILTDALPLLADLRWETADIARRVASSPSSPVRDDVLEGRMRAVTQAANSAARLIDPLTACREAARAISYAPRPACESLDPEYQNAMSGGCLQ